MKQALLFLAGCAILAGLVWYAGLESVEQALALLGLHGVALLALLHLPILALLGLAWWYASGKSAPPSVFMAGRFVRESTADMLPFSQVGGIAAGLRFAVLKGEALLPAALSLFVDLIGEFSAKLPYVAAGLLLLLYLEPGSDLLVPLAFGLTAVCAGGAAVVVFRAPLLARLSRSAKQMIARWTSHDLDAAAVTDAFARRRFAPNFTLHVVSWFLGAAECWLIFFLMDLPVSPAKAIVIDSLANALRTFGFFIPAAAGVQEGAYIAVCALFGIAPSAALAFSLARRAREITLGLLGLAFWQSVELGLFSRASRRRAPPPQPNPATPHKDER